MVLIATLHYQTLVGRPWAEGREAEIMELLAFLGRAGYQSADALARGRSVRWLCKLADAVGDLLRAEAEAMRSASKGNG